MSGPATVFDLHGTLAAEFRQIGGSGGPAPRRPLPETGRLMLLVAR
jgi:hypothetical protein